MDRESKHWILTFGKVLTGVVYAIIVVYLIILTLAFFLKLFGANPAADFADWVYTAADRIMEPFRGIFPTTAITDRSVFDASLLFAIIVYSIVALLLHSLIAWITSRMAILKYEADREQYLAQTAPATAIPTTPATPATPTPGATAPPVGTVPTGGTVPPPGPTALTWSPSGEADHHSGTPGEGRVDLGAAAVGLGDLADDGQAEAGAAVRGAAGLVEAGEPLEHPLPVGPGDAGAVVRHGQLDVIVDPGQRDLHLRSGVTSGVVDEVADQPAK